MKVAKKHPLPDVINRKLKASVLAVTAIFLVLICFAMPACSSPSTDENEDIALEFTNSLMQMNTAALDGIYPELEDINTELYAIEENLLELEQVVNPALEWANEQIEIQKQRASEHLSVPEQIRVPPEDFVHLQNERYWVTMIEIFSEGYGTADHNFTSSIIVTDITEEVRFPYDWKVISGDLNMQKSMLEQQLATRLGPAEQAMLALLTLVDYSDSWTIEKLSDSEYSISGPGLGWTEGISSGQWTYYRNTGQPIPVDSQAQTLVDVLSLNY